MYDLDRAGNMGNAAASQPGLAPSTTYEYTREIAAASFLYWGEHCVECAEPACFQTCGLYQERPDGRCRRFVRGIARNRKFPSARGYGAEVSFKRWGKLEARGNTVLIRHQQLMLLETLIGLSTLGLDWIGEGTSRVTGDTRWRSLTSRALDRMGRKWHSRGGRGDRPDTFLLEIFNPSAGAEALHVSMSVARKELSARTLDATALLPSFRKRIELPPGYSRHEIAYAELASVTESGLPFDIALIPEADTNPTLIFLAADFVRFAQNGTASARLNNDQPPVKCVVWDLDNTIWKGILLEDERVQPQTAAIELMHTLDQRGVLLSIASKNDFDLATSKMNEIGIEEYILYPQIGWMPKSEGIKAIAEKLNIGLDTFMFVDDNEFELDEVAHALPMVTCVNARYISKLALDPRLQGSATAEARRRRAMYREAMTRESEGRKFGEDFFAFLRSCDTRLRLLNYVIDYFERVCELLQRTNQLNFSGRKYRREDIDPVLADPRLEKWVLEYTDKFGSYGVVGFGLVSRRPQEVWIEDFMLSCRVQGRFVEQAFFNALVGGDPTVQRVVVNFTATGRNAPARQVLLAMGFTEVTDESLMRLDLAERGLSCDFIQVDCEAAIEPSRMIAVAGA